MYLSVGYQTRAAFHEEAELRAILSALEANGARPVLKSMLEAACDVLGVSRSALPQTTLFDERALCRWMDQPHYPLVELLRYEDKLYCIDPIVTAIEPTTVTTLFVWEFRHHSTPSSAESFCDLVASAIQGAMNERQVADMRVDWEPVELSSAMPMLSIHRRCFREEGLQPKQPTYTSDELQQSKLIRKRQVREFLLGLAQAGKAGWTNASAIANEDTTELLLEKGLIRKECLVLCRKDSSVLAAVENRDHFAAAAWGGAKCATCGRTFREELVHDIYSLTHQAKELMESGKWMTIWVTDLLVKSGIPIQDIAWSPESNDGQRDILATLFNQRMVFVLTDREFGLGDARSFDSRAELYRVRAGIVATTSSVSSDAKTYLKEQPRMGRPPRIEILEGEEAIRSSMMDLVERLNEDALKQVFIELSGCIDLVPFLHAWLEAQKAAGVASKEPADSNSPKIPRF